MWGALLIAPKPLLGAFHASWIWAAVFVAGMALLVAQAFLTTVLLAAGQLRTYVKLTVAFSVLGVGAAAVVLVKRRGGATSVVGLLARPRIGRAAYFSAGALARLAAPLGRPYQPRGCARAGAVSADGRERAAVYYGVNFELRNVLIQRFPLAKVDLWQAVAKLSDNYTMVFSALMSSVYYPRLAALMGQPAKLREYVRTLVQLVAVLAAVGLGLIFLLRGWLLKLLFEAHFAAARDLLWPQLLGDWAKFLTWMLLFLLIAQARVGRYVAVQAGSAALYAGLLVWLLPRYGLLVCHWRTPRGLGCCC